MKNRIKGMSMCNPVDLERDYLIAVAEYAILHGYDHFEMIGPTHHPIKGNIDGMMFYKKYSQFNKTKDKEYVEYCLSLVNEVCARLKSHGIKTYFWHHELEIPYEFDEEFPEIHNAYGDVEITHPLVKDFLENKIIDFFAQYPDMSGIVLTLHETRIPLLKLKNQKLGKVERVKYVTEILYKTCKSLGKELIVRPFASLEEDYTDLMAAYEQIARDLVVCDKWTQFDWSLTLPNNAFYNKIKNNPLMVETDIFGEYFGKGFLPIMLKEHIKSKFAYCEGFGPRGYVSRIDRNGFVPFGTPNEVNLDIMNACIEGEDVDAAIDAFFERNYGEAASEVRALMEGTEELQVMYFYVNGFDFTQLSAFPDLNFVKNSYKFEMMREDYVINSNEWFIPRGFRRPPIEEIYATKRRAIEIATEKLETLKKLESKIPTKAYEALYVRFANLYYVTRLFDRHIDSIITYAKFFETGAPAYEEAFLRSLNGIVEINEEGKRALGLSNYYPTAMGVRDSLSQKVDESLIDKAANYASDVKASFEYAKEMKKKLDSEHLTDYCIAGSAIEGHGLLKEVNFSDTAHFFDGECRVCGTLRGKAFSTVKSHGWFSYDMKIKPNCENELVVSAKGLDGALDLRVTVGDEVFEISRETDKVTDFTIKYKEREGKDSVKVRFDRVTGNTPAVYLIRVK